MTIEGLTGKAQTVLGRIEPEELGITLPHEHILFAGDCWFREPTEATAKVRAHQPVTTEILGWLRYHFAQNIDDAQFTDAQLAIKELLHFKYAGGSSIVDLTHLSSGRDPLALAHISRATGLNIIMSAGYYVEASWSPEMKAKSEEEITEEIVRDITEGVGNTGVHAGMIGEIGCSWPLTKGEVRSLRASARAQRLTGAPLNIHWINEEAHGEIIQILKEAGADLSRTVMSHIDLAARNPETRRRLAEAGCYLEYDFFGREGYPMQTEIDRPNDHYRLNEIAQHINEGYLNQILISQDTCLKHSLVTYGGVGYAHILNNVVPLMRIKGFSEDTIRTIIVDNPKRLLTFV